MADLAPGPVLRDRCRLSEFGGPQPAAGNRVDHESNQRPAVLPRSERDRSASTMSHRPCQLGAYSIYDRRQDSAL
jgi:hypothetical protein